MKFGCLKNNFQNLLTEGYILRSYTICILILKMILIEIEMRITLNYRYKLISTLMAQLFLFLIRALYRVIRATTLQKATKFEMAKNCATYSQLKSTG